VPDGIRLRPYAGRADDAAWVAISNAALARDAGYHAVNESDMATEKDNVRAQRLYARAGFTLDREAFTVRKTLPRL
jgi:ribosomal protein S18 acetylase RimI-like enzyme